MTASNLAAVSEPLPAFQEDTATEARIPEALLRANFIGTCSIVAVRRPVFERFGNFRAGLRGAQDLEMWWRAALVAVTGQRARSLYSRWRGARRL